MQFAGHFRFHEKQRPVYNIFNVLLFMMSHKSDTFPGVPHLENENDPEYFHVHLILYKGYIQNQQIYIRSTPLYKNILA